MPLLRSATQADLPAINAIYNHYVIHSTCTYQTVPSTEEERAEWFAAHGPKHPVIVAVDEATGTVVGWGSLSRFHPRQAYENSVEDSVYLHHDWLGRGVGSLVLGELLRLAKELGHHTVLGGADSEQAASIALHLKFGFEKVSHLKQVGFKQGRWLDVIWMQKMLCPILLLLLSSFAEVVYVSAFLAPIQGAMRWGIQPGVPAHFVRSTPGYPPSTLRVERQIHGNIS